MKKYQFPLILSVLLLLISGCGKEKPITEAVALEGETESIEVRFTPEWQIDADMPFGGVIIWRGEGNSGRSPETPTNSVITVNLPVYTEAPPEPVELTHESITAMDINVITPGGETLHFGNDEIATAAYRIAFTHVWPGDITVTYIVRNIYTGD